MYRIADRNWLRIQTPVSYLAGPGCSEAFIFKLAIWIFSYKIQIKIRTHPHKSVFKKRINSKKCEVKKKGVIKLARLDEMICNR
jgi:hypothetical protein